MRLSGEYVTEVAMSSPAPFEPIAALLERSLNIKHVYGEPVQHGDTTVIPVAQVAYGFGAGGGRGGGSPDRTNRRRATLARPRRRAPAVEAACG